MSNVFIGRPAWVERKVTPKPSYNACQYRDKFTGDYCGAETGGAVYCADCKPRTLPIGRARYSFSEFKSNGRLST